MSDLRTLTSKNSRNVVAEEIIHIFRLFVIFVDLRQQKNRASMLNCEESHEQRLLEDYMMVVAEHKKGWKP
jgi:hypothetical protein